MSYTPTNWQTGDTVTAEKLNKLEQGVSDAGGGIVVASAEVGEELFSIDYENPLSISLDKTYEELYSATYSAIHIYIKSEGETVGEFWFTLSAWGDTLMYIFSPEASDNIFDLSYRLGIGVDPNNGAAIYAFSKKPTPFVVTMTPTALDYSGTMDKTPQEITAAYNAGREIRFVIPSLGAAFNAFEFVTAGANVQAGSVLTYRTGSSHLLIECLTSGTDDDSTYFTHIYTLTPAI